MHISHTGVLDAAAYAPTEAAGPERSTLRAGLAMLVPLTALYAFVAVLTAVAIAASGAGLTWTPMG